MICDVFLLLWFGCGMGFGLWIFCGCILVSDVRGGVISGGLGSSWG